MGKEVKTNAMRLLDKKKVKYTILNYECSAFVNGIETARINEVALEQSFKTLVLVGKSKEYYVFVLPVDQEIDLKNGAKLVKEKSLEMLPLKDLTKVTGYVRGGCSPIGMKKLFKTWVDESALNFDRIYVSGGRIGTSIGLNPKDLKKVLPVEFADFLIH